MKRKAAEAPVQKHEEQPPIQAFFLTRPDSTELDRLSRPDWRPALKMGFFENREGQACWKAWVEDKTIGEGEPRRFWRFLLAIADKYSDNPPWVASLTATLARPAYGNRVAEAWLRHHAGFGKYGCEAVEDGLPAAYVRDFLSFFNFELADPPDVSEKRVKKMLRVHRKAFPEKIPAAEREKTVMDWAATQRKVELRAAEAMRGILAEYCTPLAYEERAEEEVRKSRAPGEDGKKWHD
ncbi:MAG: hypothetical protein V1787_06405 [Candidatus Micrarchaeota archaeon]